MATQLIPFSQLAKRENEAFRKAFDVETKKERESFKKDFEMMDPDWLRLPSGRVIAFQESKGLVIVFNAVDERAKAAILAFFDNYDADYTSIADTWESFGGCPERNFKVKRYGQHSKVYRIAYRGGSGYSYGISQYTPGENGTKEIIAE